MTAINLERFLIRERSDLFDRVTEFAGRAVVAVSGDSPAVLAARRAEVSAGAAVNRVARPAEGWAGVAATVPGFPEHLVARPAEALVAAVGEVRAAAAGAGFRAVLVEHPAEGSVAGVEAVPAAVPAGVAAAQVARPAEASDCPVARSARAASGLVDRPVAASRPQALPAPSLTPKCQVSFSSKI